jgi:hypothetical protein
VSGQTIFEPTPSHGCAPGGTRVSVNPSSPFTEFATHTMRPPFSGEFPVGCRWQCDDCGQVWVRRKPRRQYPIGGQCIIGGEVRWRRETWLERRLRQRKTLSPPIKGDDVD